MEMQTPEEEVISIMKKEGIDLTATLPCDRIKNLLPLVSENFREIKLTREENGIGICAGAYMAGGKPMMLIQSTGLGNMINALESLNIVCGIPLPILSSWRGVYKEGIEAQVPLGTHLPGILEGAGIAYTIIDSPDKIGLLEDVIQDAYENLRPHVALVSPKTWEGSTCCAWEALETPEVPKKEKVCKFRLTQKVLEPLMVRNDAISAVAAELDGEAMVTNIGVPCKELYAAGDRALNFYMFGSMGLVSSIGLGLALCTDRQVAVFDGDGSILMNPNALLEIGREAPANLTIIALDNGAYGSTGSQETCALRYIDLEILANACGIQNSHKVNTEEELTYLYKDSLSARQTSFLHVILKPGNTKAPNIPFSPAEITERFIKALRDES